MHTYICYVESLFENYLPIITQFGNVLYNNMNLHAFFTYEIPLMCYCIHKEK